VHQLGPAHVDQELARHDAAPPHLDQQHLLGDPGRPHVDVRVVAQREPPACAVALAIVRTDLDDGRPRRFEREIRREHGVPCTAVGRRRPGRRRRALRKGSDLDLCREGAKARLGVGRVEVGALGEGGRRKVRRRRDDEPR